MISCCAKSSLLLATGLAAVAFAQNRVDRVVERARAEFDVPGIAVAIVKDGKIVLAKGYGVRKVGRPEPVTEHSLFRIASNTKAFTSAALAILVDEGKIHWDDRVVDLMPSFQMYDPYVTREMTVTDLGAPGRQQGRGMLEDLGGLVPESHEGLDIAGVVGSKLAGDHGFGCGGSIHYGFL